MSVQGSGCISHSDFSCLSRLMYKKKKGDTRSCSSCTQTHLGLLRSATQVMMHARQNVQVAMKKLRSPSTGASNARHLKLQKIPQLPLSDLTCAKWRPIVPQRHLTSLGGGHRLRTVQKVSLLERCKNFFGALELLEELPLQKLKGLHGCWSLYVDRKSC